MEPLADQEKQRAALRGKFRGQIENGVTSGANERAKARAAYLAICLDFAPGMKERHPVLRSAFPAGEAIRQKVLADGLETPAQIKWWV